LISLKLSKILGHVSVYSKYPPMKIIVKMPDNSDFEDIMAKHYYVHKVNKGIQELDDSKGIPHDSVKEDLQKWLE